MRFELVPQVNNNDEDLGLVERAVAYKEGLIHRAAHAIIRNDDGKYLIQKRSKSKASWPDYHDLGCAETVRPKESYVAAIRRGMREELKIEQLTLMTVRKKYYQEYFWEDYKVFTMLHLFLVETTEEPVFEDGEVDEIKWLTESEVTNLVTDYPEKCTPWLVQDWQYFLQTK
jgi:isopentenyl-diphosphate Delta-isomerase